MKMSLCLLPGDGIGPEVTAQAVQVLEVVARCLGISLQYKEAPIGGAAYDLTGDPLPPETVALCRGADAVLLGAVGGAQWDALPPDKRPETGLLGIRAALGLFANLRPARIFPALKEVSPLKNAIIKDVDVLVVRELTGGIYFGDKGRTMKSGALAAFDTMLYTVPEVERVAHAAFRLARQRQNRLTSIDKANVLEVSRLWRETVSRVAAHYPDVTLTHMYVDNAAMQLVRDPAQFDVIVTGNLFGDILSDEAAMIAGSIGMLPSASLGDGSFGLYEPVHGSAPDIAGQNKANPLAAILSVAMMLRYTFDMPVPAAAIEDAVAASLSAGRTPDLWEDGLHRFTTADAGAFVCRRVGELLG